MTSESPIKKTCIKCKASDVTTFSSCRNCGTKYDFKPMEKTKETNIGMPLVLLTAVALIGGSAYAYIQVQSMYSHPDKLIGKTVQCDGTHILVSVTKDDMVSLDGELLQAQKTDPKTYGKSSVGGMMSAASALDSLATGKNNKYDIIFHYAYIGKINFVGTDTKEPLKVKVVAATSSSEKFPLVQVKVLNGPKAGTLWWANTDQLNLGAQDKG